MKDNALRDVLIESGTVGFDNREGVTVLTPVFLEMKVNAIIEYLGIDIRYQAEKYVAKKKNAPKAEDQRTDTQQANYAIATTLLKRWAGAMSGDTACPESVEALRIDTAKFFMDVATA